MKGKVDRSVSRENEKYNIWKIQYVSINIRFVNVDSPPQQSIYSIVIHTQKKYIKKWRWQRKRWLIERAINVRSQS